MKPFFQSFLDKDKRENFWYYHKSHVVIGIFLLTIVVSLVIDTISNRVPKLELAYLNVPSSSQEEITSHAHSLQQSSAEEDRLEISGNAYYLAENIDIEQQQATIQQILTRLVASEIDVFICEYDSFLTYVEEDCFADMTPLLDKSQVNALSHQLYYATASESPQQKPIIGLTMYDADTENTYILSIPYFSQQQEAAMELIVSYWQSNNQ